MTEKSAYSAGTNSAAWARFRFSVVGVLLSAPLPRGALRAAHAQRQTAAAKRPRSVIGERNHSSPFQP